MATALLVVDIQQYYLAAIPADLPQRIIGHFQATSYDLIAFSTFLNRPDSNFVASLKWDKCSDESEAKLPDTFQPFVTEHNVFQRAAYSAFKTTGLNDFLQKNHVERLVLCGVDTDACVLATAFEAFDLGYHVKVDFSLTYSSGDLEKHAQKIMERSIISRD